MWAAAYAVAYLHHPPKSRRKRRIPKAPPPTIGWDGVPVGRPRFSTHPRAEYWREYKRKKYHERKRGAA